MHRAARLGSLSTIPALALAALLGASCSSKGDTPATPADAGALADAGASAELTLTAACGEAIDAVYADPGALTAPRGAILKCALDRTWTRESLERLARENQFAYTGPAFKSGARSFRVSYRTERGDDKGSPGYTSALVFVPDAPTAGAPAVVVAHGTAGQGPACTPSKGNLEALGNSFSAMIFPLVGAGMPVIVPDYAGYAGYGAAGNPPSGYALTADVGKSVLDGARALRAMLSGVSDKTVLVGHSQGGHSVLSALALSESYGVPVTGVVAYAPLWFRARSSSSRTSTPSRTTPSRSP